MTSTGSGTGTISYNFLQNRIGNAKGFRAQFILSSSGYEKGSNYSDSVLDPEYSTITETGT